MKLAVIAANGQAGKAIVEEVVKRGHEVTAIVRSENKSQSESIIKKDLFELTKDDLTGFQNNKYELSKNANTPLLNPKTICSAMLRNIVKCFFKIHYGLIVNYLLFIWHFNEI